MATSSLGLPNDLDESWLNEHKDHSLCWMSHTVFEKKKKSGMKFRECICYTCNKSARQLIEEVDVIKAQVIEKKKRSRKKSNKDTVILGA
jgi:hypothetical protein